MELNFTKMEGLGNDFVMLDDRNGAIVQTVPYPVLAKKLCSRRFGVGGDGIIIIIDSETADVGFKIFNPDGSEPEMCGNGMRCFAKLVFEQGIVTKQRFTVETLAGTIIPEILLSDTRQVEAICVDMGEPILEPDRIPFKCNRQRAVNEQIQVKGETVSITAVSMGNPHAVIFVDDVKKIDLENLGRAIETHELFPAKTNVEFVTVLNDQELVMRVWERGAGETLACGTGASAVLVAASLNGLTRETALVHLAGGDLSIHWDQQSNHLFKTGPATHVFTGRIKI
ncbi:DapF [Desulforapulum autotrophicum HRM2]|uniref:Diaminopimelate epimerase n=1 Tax=Desulforapulum autotrophicum (strain ATCC 43914 / DSM 3382 / VKM B-1955 / HRM2) TaxID=177437 RepID=DAPF_DESAH|nr:diaminopimelate epimerase [Desulforapulum autotrophicum]C0QAP3.1 RecName: Full=Diaminopimelate epimerase; Short=DAP epimerase; AltName: Full=PLP-independent amino acid racemase [Desulforapulum autotrophicum HRM2]ACN16826.1 DapF [Desulforapulum autotrophicum HRM2]